MSMSEYHKIQSVYKRSKEKPYRFLEGQWSLPEFEYLSKNPWTYTEKIDGTNIRVYWDHLSHTVKIGGKTDAAQIPVFLYEKIQQKCPPTLFEEHYPTTSILLYGEGYGAKIQKAGENYIKNGVDLILYDIKIVDMFLRRESVEDIASKLNIEVVPIIGEGDILHAIDMCKNGFFSHWGEFYAEGIVLRPKVELQDRRGQRIITKVKYKDFH